jgi:hypothetical protein
MTATLMSDAPVRGVVRIFLTGIELIAETGDGQGVEHADRATWIGNPLKLRHGPRVPQRGLNFTNSPSPRAPFVDRARGHYVDGTHILTKAHDPD